MSSIGGSLAAGNLQAGYQAGIVSEDELDEIKTQLPEMVNGEIQSISVLKQKWEEALVGQPWHVQKLGGMATSTIVELVAKLQEKTVRQANAMKWINENALPIIQNNSTMVKLLSSSSTSSSSSSSSLISSDNDIDNVAAAVKLRFNNTRAKFETDRNVWSASMDVFDEQRKNVLMDNDSASAASDALAALTEGLNDGSDDTMSSFKGSIDVDQSASRRQSKNIGLVNAYFIPDDEIKILVVEIDDVMHNLTWKGLD